MTAATQFVDLVRQSPVGEWLEPEPGSLLPDECAAVAAVLSGHTATPDDCFFCVWEGYGSAWTTLNRLAERAPARHPRASQLLAVSRTRNSCDRVPIGATVSKPDRVVAGGPGLVRGQ